MSAPSTLRVARRAAMVRISTITLVLGARPARLPAQVQPQCIRRLNQTIGARIDIDKPHIARFTLRQSLSLGVREYNPIFERS
jgi:hypothetical protein